MKKKRKKMKGQTHPGTHPPQTNKRRKMDPIHGAKIQPMHQVMNIRGKDLLNAWKQYPRSSIYHWAA